MPTKDADRQFLLCESAPGHLFLGIHDLFCYLPTNLLYFATKLSPTSLQIKECFILGGVINKFTHPTNI